MKIFYRWSHWILVLGLIGASTQAQDSLTVLPPYISAAQDSSEQEVLPPGRALSEAHQDLPALGILTDPEARFYQSNFLPVSLGQRGRLFSSSYRGMPPGFFTFRYGHKQLDNPITGAYNEQWLPYYQIAGRYQPAGLFQEALSPPEPRGQTAETRIIFTQDYIVNLNAIDINFGQKFGRHFVQLSGSNMGSDGSSAALDYTKTAVNTYRNRIHLHLSEAWQADVYYWQMRQRYNLEPETGSFERDKFKMIGHYTWLEVNGQLSDRDYIVLTPFYETVEDDYSNGDNNRRDNRYHATGGEVAYHRVLGNWEIGGNYRGRLYRNSGRHSWLTLRETDGRMVGTLAYDNGRSRLSVEGGGYRHNNGGSKAAGLLSLEVPIGRQQGVEINAFSEPQPVPQGWRTVDHDSVPCYHQGFIMERQGAAAAFRQQFGRQFLWQLEPFAYRMTGYPVLHQGDSLYWSTQTIENYGARLYGELSLAGFTLKNDLTYNHNYESAFAAQVNNISTLERPLSLFNGALQVNMMFSWHYLGNFQLIDYQRRLTHYALLPVQQGPFNIADFRLTAKFRDAILFFIWENFLSEDYQIVSGTIDDLLIFRLGVDWVLFD